MSELKLYPQELPECLKEIPDLLDGNLVHVADMILAARPNQEGVWACEMALELMNDATVRASNKMPGENLSRFLKVMTDATNQLRGCQPDGDLVVRKMNFCWQILFACMSDGKWRDEYLGNAANAIEMAADIFRSAVEDEEAKNVA